MCITIYAKPNSRKTKIEKVSDDMYKVWTKEPAKDNKANFDIIKILASYFNVPLSYVKLLKGRKSKHKIFKIITG